MISGDILILSANNVRDVVSRVDPIEFIHLMGRVFRAFSDKAPISAPHRTSIESTSCTSLFMPARIDGFGGTAIKIVSVPRQSVDGLPATTLIMDEESGGVKAVINARDLTALRTAAGVMRHIFCLVVG
jgi:ornithine cyclodeaminase/alanine dehydrogenase-like protein (mu-crystallin family)